MKNGKYEIMVRFIEWRLWEMREFDHVEKWYHHKLETALKNKNHKIL